VAEVESYQRIIDGARQVVANWRPRIDVDPDWPVVKLGEVCVINPRKSELNGTPGETKVSFVPMADLNENRMEFTVQAERPLSEVIKGYTYFRDNDVLLAKVTPCFENGKAGIARFLTNGIGFGSSEYIVLRASKDILPVWIYLNVTSPHFREEGERRMTGTGGLQRVPIDFVSTYQIPLPSVEVQQEVIRQIEDEQTMIQANRELVIRFEQKIKDRIAKVWGEGK
jgi:restriction endonuclease S subunit